MECTTKELAEYVGALIEGDGSLRISGCASPMSAHASEVIFVEAGGHAEATARMLEAGAKSAARCVILAPGVAMQGKTLLRAANPRLAFAKALAWLHPAARIAQGIHATAIVARSVRLAEGVGVGPYAVIEEEAEIGPGSQIGAHSFVGRGVRVGADCRIYPRATLYSGVRLGARVAVHSGAVVGADGFGYVPTDEGYVKFPQIGTVEIEDDVEIGANTTIDRGALDATRIARGVKIDNLVQIGHNVEVGEHSVVAAQAGIAGSCKVGRKVILTGQSGLSGHCTLEDGVILAPQSGVPEGKTWHAGAVLFGSPARPLDKAKKILAVYGHLPELWDRVRKLEAAGGATEAPKG
jgi:UDP-3-O-[3-hydroxymyristoyl] glucosamine N-acyltransferase